MKTKTRKRKQKEGDVACTGEETQISNAAPTVQPASAAPILLTVTRISENPYMAYGVDAQGKPHGVRVQSSQMYNINDKLLAVEQAVDGVMLQVGPRPNYKGEPHYRYRLEMELKKLGK